MTKRCRTARPPAELGFSLPEIVVVVVLVSLVTLISVPSYLNYSSNQRALGAARALASDLRVAQQEAVTRRTIVDVVFSETDAACGNGRSYTVQLQASAAAVRRVCLEADVGWDSLPSTLTFETLGIPAAGTPRTEFRLRSTRTGKVYTVVLEGQTGAVTCRPEQEIRCGG